MERRLAAILAADVVGYSRLIRADEEGTIAALKSLRELHIDPAIAAHRERIVKLMGDGILTEFASVLDAVRAGVDMQSALAAHNRDLPEDRRIQLRIGINLGDVVIDGEDIQGDGVNVAARLEGLAQPGGICVSGGVHDQVRDKLALAFEDLGKQELKNIDRPMRAWHWAPAGVGGSAPPEGRKPAALQLPDKPSIAVLPFDNLAGAADQEQLADGFVEAITATLSRIRSFFVIARNSAFTYKGKAVNVADVGRELGVAYVLEGSVQRAGSRIRVTVQLIETGGGAHVWAERYDGTIDDIFELQDRITEQVAGALQPSIRLAEIERARRKRPSDLGAYDYAMQAMPHVWALEKEESRKALELLEKSLAIDPDYPLALSLAGWCHAQRSVYNWADDIAGSQAEALRLAERAAQLSGDDPLILAVLGAVHTFVRNFGTARVLLERAVALDPNAAWAWSRLGWLEAYSDRPANAFRHFERALRLSPLDPLNFNNYVGIASAHDIAMNLEDAVRNYRRALEERPHAEWIYRSLAPALCAAGRMDEARAAFARLMSNYPDLTIARVKQAMVFSQSYIDRMCDNLRKLGLPD
jgi:adenylate cyclase